MPDEDAQQQFVMQLTEHQNRMYGYIYSMLGDHSQAADVLQETNLVLWRHTAEWVPGHPFLPWAFAFARFQILACLRDQKRERCLLDNDLIETISEDAAAEAAGLEDRREALRGCLLQLSEKNRELIQLRYFGGKSIAAIAGVLQRSAEAVKVSLLRIRRSLHDCVLKQISANELGRR